MRKRRKVTPEKAASYNRALALRGASYRVERGEGGRLYAVEISEPTRVGSGLVLAIAGSRVVVYEDATEDEKALVAWFDVGVGLTTGDVFAIGDDALLLT